MIDLTLIEILEKECQEQKLFNSLFSKEYYNVKHVEYLNCEEYRFYKIAISRGISTKNKTKYVEIDGVQYNASTGKERTSKSIEHSKYTSLNRTKQKIYDYALSNDWTGGYFFTITFNKDLVDRYNYKECYNRIYQFLKNVKSKNQDLKYIFVPERHRDGAWHFHGICVNCDNLKLIDSKIKKNGKKIYNINSRSFKYGYTTVSEIEDTKKVSSYITKYITKELIEHTKNQHRYLFSKNLDIPIISTELRYDYEIKLDKLLLERCNKNFEYKKVHGDDNSANVIEYIHLKK